MYQQGGFLLISTRNDEKLEVAYSLLDLNTTTFLWSDIVFEESWWIGVTHFYKEMIVFHTFEDSQNFQKKSIFGFDISSSEVVWVLESYQPMEAVKDKIVCKKEIEGITTLVEVDVLTGNVAKTYVDSVKNKKNKIPISNVNRYPLHYVEGSEAFNTVSQYLQKKLGIAIIGACDYMEYKGKVIVSFFVKPGDGMVNEMVVFDSNGEVIQRETMDSDLKGLASDTFFIADEALIFVESKNQLKGLLIRD